MRNWIVGGVLAAGLVYGHPAAAFDGTGETESYIDFGPNCRISLIDDSSFSLVSVILDGVEYDAGGEYWQSGALWTWPTVVTVDVLAACLNTQATLITDLQAIGADDAVGYANQTYLGFQFTLA